MGPGEEAGERPGVVAPAITVGEGPVLGQAGLLSSQQDTFFTSIWTLGGGALARRREYQLRTQHELWVRRQVELGKMSAEEGRARIKDYIPQTSL